MMENERKRVPCAPCKMQKKKCDQNCLFAPYFPADEPQKFTSVKRIFGASNISKMLRELAESERGEAVRSMVYEANARLENPVYGCFGVISALRQQMDTLQTQLVFSQAEVEQLRMRLRMYEGGSTAPNIMMPQPMSAPDMDEDKAGWGADLTL